MTTRANSRRLRVAVGFGVTVAMLFAAPSTSAVATASSLSAPDVAAIQRLVDRIVEAGAPGATMVVRDGSSSRTFTSGVSDVKSDRLLQPGDQFRVGSITKTFVATVTLQLVDEGALKLDDPVAAYLPHLLPDGEHITLRQLLNHTSGLFNYTEDPDFFAEALSGRPFSARELIGYSSRHDVLFPPGTDWSYSNTNYIVLGLLDRIVGGASVKDQITERILDPLGMHNTRFAVRNPEIVRPHAHGYLIRKSGRLWDITTLFNPTIAWAAGAVISTNFDLATFYGQLLAGKLLPPDLLAEMKDLVPGADYGLGIFTVELSCGTAWGHDGLFPGYYVMALSTEDGTHQAVISINVDPANGFPPRAVLRTFYDAGFKGFCGPDAPDDGSAFAGPDLRSRPLPGLGDVRARVG